MDDVPDLRVFGTRLVQCAAAFVLGQAAAWPVARLLPHGHGREGSTFAPLFLVIAIGCGLGIAFYALFEAIRRARSRERPLAFAIVRSGSARSRSPRRSR